MQKIVLVGINARYTHTNLALRYLRNLTPPGRYEVKLLEFSINQPWLEILTEIVTQKPAYVALSVYIWNSRLVKLIIPEIAKLLPACKLILGGPEVSYSASEWLQDHPSISYIISGSGEAAWQYLLENDFELPEAVITHPPLPLAELPFPYLKDEFSQLKNRYVYYEASRGCPFKCSYCLSSRTDQKLQLKDLDQVKSELELFRDADLKIVKFVDRSFNADPLFSRSIWKYLSEIQTTTKFHFEIQPDLLGEEDIAILSSAPAGRFQLEIGIQSLDPVVLKTIGRYSNWSSIKPKIKSLCNLSNLHLHVDLIVGLPFQNKVALENSFNEVYQLETDHFQLGFLKVLTGTEMSEKKGHYEIIHTSSAPYEVLSTKWLTFEQIDHYRQISRWLDALYNTGHFTTTLQELLQAYSSSLQFYESFLHWLKQNLKAEVTRNWQVNAKLLSQYIAENFPDMKHYLLDCLRWDWCRFAASHYYPDFLQNELLKSAKKEGRALIREKYLSQFPQRQLNRAIFFKTSDQNFADKYLRNKSIAVFLQGELKMIL